MSTTTAAHRAERAGHAETMAALNAMHLATAGRGPLGQSDMPIIHLCNLLSQISEYQGESRGAFIAGVAMALNPWLLLSLKCKHPCNGGQQ